MAIIVGVMAIFLWVNGRVSNGSDPEPGRHGAARRPHGWIKSSMLGGFAWFAGEWELGRGLYRPSPGHGRGLPWENGGTPPGGPAASAWGSSLCSGSLNGSSFG